METPAITDRPAPTAATPTAGSSRMGKDEFVKLLLAQLSHQDPTAPMDSQAFVAQLAQFSQVELMSSANTDLERLLVGQAAAQQTSVVNLVGKDVLYKSDAVELAADGPAHIQATLAAPAANVTATVTNDSGKVVRTLKLGAQDAGALDIPWDGRDDNGSVQPPGTYHVSVGAANASGDSVAVESRAQAHVTGISFDDGVPVLLSGSTHIQLSEVIQISERNAP